MNVLYIIYTHKNTVTLFEQEKTESAIVLPWRKIKNVRLCGRGVEPQGREDLVLFHQLLIILLSFHHLCHSQSLEDETEFLRMCQDSPRVIRSFGVKVTQEDDILLYNLLLEYASAGSLLSNDQLGLPELQVQKHTKHRKFFLLLLMMMIRRRWQRLLISGFR